MKIQRTTILLILSLAALVVWVAVLFGGCAKKLDGDTYANEKPIVWFVNVPPEDSRSSVNPIINWMGQDRDGQIDFYRYIVVREDAMGAMLGKPVDWNPSAPGEKLTEVEVRTFIDQHLPTISDTMWTVLLVRADATDPHTSNIVPMSAQIDDPVRSYVPQFVFVQAFDEEGSASDVAFRRFLRNDNPPTTRIVAFVPGQPFINSVLPSGPATGIRFRWEGTDAIDYPTDAPPFEFQWRLLGPYDSATYEALIDSFLVEVFVTNDAQVLEFGLPADTVGWDTLWIDSPLVFDTIPVLQWPALIVCDTTYENGAPIETCDTILYDTLDGTTVYGTVDELLRVFTPEFENSSFYDKLADSSHDEFGNIWVTDTRDSIYNSYWNAPSDTTQTGKFIFVVRSRDDAHVPDLTPSWVSFDVIDPQHERDILVLNWAATSSVNKAVINGIRPFWAETVEAWRTTPSTIDHSGIVFDPEIDVIRNMTGYSDGTKLLETILKYKVFVVFQDVAQSGAWNAPGDAFANVLVGLQTGVNVWVMTRVPTQGHGSVGSGFAVDDLSSTYQYFFGVAQYTFPGWSSRLGNGTDEWGYGGPRVEHFIGTLSLDPDQWPELKVDTAMLRTRYEWLGSLDPLRPPFYPYMPEIGALPQVGWMVRTFETEAMYLFKSKYGQEHEILPELSFHGRPVGIRLNRGLFRTVHHLFTPLSLDPISGQKMVNGVLNWLYDGRVEFSSGNRGADQQAVASELSDIYWQCYWQANGDRDRFYELLQRSYR